MSFKIASWRFRRLVFHKAELLTWRFLLTLIKNLEPSSSVLSKLFQASTVDTRNISIKRKMYFYQKNLNLFWVIYGWSILHACLMRIVYKLINPWRKSIWPCLEWSHILINPTCIPLLKIEQCLQMAFAIWSACSEGLGVCWLQLLWEIKISLYFYLLQMMHWSQPESH